jgi:ribosomal protein S12 methylthiotransferase accessory factor
MRFSLISVSATVRTGSLKLVANLEQFHGVCLPLLWSHGSVAAGRADKAFVTARARRHHGVMPAMQSIAALASDGGGAKRFRDGTHRTVSPDETVARLQPLLPAFGITRVANVTGLDRIGVPVVMVCRPNSRSVAVSQGKGLTLAAAKASGIMEAAEGYHAERIEQPLRLGSSHELGRTLMLAEVETLPLCRDSRWHRDLQILWIEATDLNSGERVWVPYEVVHANYTHPLPTGSGCFAATTNGLASGNHLLEAICHAICEVVERDASSLSHHSAKRARDAARIDPRSVSDPACRSVLDRIVQAGMSVAVWETTTDVGIAAFECLIADERAAGGHAGFGAGCHATAEIALLRALTEAVQVRNTYVTGSRDDLRAQEYVPSEWAERLRQLRQSMASAVPTRDFGAVSSHCFDSFEEECRWLLGRLAAVGCSRVLAVDLTKPEFGLPVVRVVIPGLEGPDDADYLPGPRARKAGARAS